MRPPADGRARAGDADVRTRSLEGPGPLRNFPVIGTKKMCVLVLSVLSGGGIGADARGSSARRHRTPIEFVVTSAVASAMRAMRAIEVLRLR